MRYRLIALFLTGFLLFGTSISVLAQGPTPTSTIASPSPLYTGSPAAVTFQGTGDDVTATFTLEAGLAIFTTSNDSDSYFATELLDQNGETSDLLVSTTGIYHGSKALGVREDNIIGAKPGQYVLNITAKGNWSVMIEQPRILATPAAPPLDFVGNGDRVSPFFTLNAGLATFAMNHDGKNNFSIDLYSVDGKMEDLLVNQIGPYTGRKAIRVQPNNIIGASPGVHLLSVTADGTWKITISQ